MRLLSQVVDEQFLHRPDVFRRDALELTFQLLRESRPDLALLVQNLLQGIPLEDGDSPDGQVALQVRMQRLQVNAICLALHQHCRGFSATLGNAAREVAQQWIVIFALIRDWETLEASDCCD